MDYYVISCHPWYLWIVTWITTTTFVNFSSIVCWCYSVGKLIFKDLQIHFYTVTENHWRSTSSLSFLYVQFQEGESVFWSLIAHWGAWCQNGRSLFWRVGFRVTWVTKHLQEPLGALPSANYNSVTVWRVKANES